MFAINLVDTIGCKILTTNQTVKNCLTFTLLQYMQQLHAAVLQGYFFIHMLLFELFGILHIL